MIFGGYGTKDARAEVLKLSDKLKAPIGYAFRGKDVLEADNPNAVGMTGLLGWGAVTAALGRRASVDLGLTGDVGETLRALLPKLDKREDSKFLDKITKHHTKIVKSLQTYVDHKGSGEGLRPEMVATALSDLAEDDAVV